MLTRRRDGEKGEGVGGGGGERGMEVGEEGDQLYTYPGATLSPPE